jgi:hypothetical protein
MLKIIYRQVYKFWADRLAKKNYFNMPMPMSKPPIIENRLSCSPSDSQSLFVGVAFGWRFQLIDATLYLRAKDGKALTRRIK